MADVNYGYGSDQSDSSTTSAYMYTVMAEALVIETFDGVGFVKVIKIYNETLNGRLRLWKGTVVGLDFTFDSYDPAVDIDLTGKGTGWITLSAPGDFTPFAVTAATALIFYTHSTPAEGCIIGRAALAPGWYGYVSGGPPSAPITLSVGGTLHRLSVLLEGDFPNKLEGVTKNKSGDILANCDCFLFKDNLDDTLTFIEYTQSNGSGAYSFTSIPDLDAQYIVVGWKDNTPHVFDVTDHVLQPEVP